MKPLVSQGFIDWITALSVMRNIAEMLEYNRKIEDGKRENLNMIFTSHTLYLKGAFA